MRRLFPMGLLLLALVACVSTNATLLNAARTPHPAISPDSVVLYLTPDEVHAPYEEIALLHASGDIRFTDEADMYASMRKKAASLGANGVILDATKDPGGGERIAAALVGTPAKRKGRAVAIYVQRDHTSATADTTALRR